MSKHTFERIFVYKLLDQSITTIIYYHMKPWIIKSLAIVPFLCCCTSSERSISVVCDKGNRGDYEIKWEIYPEPANTPVYIYSSNNDSIFFDTPTVTAQSDDYIAVINMMDSLNRQYFKIKVGDYTSGVISNRFFLLDNIQNIRDVGGYYNSQGRQVRWNKIFRSGSLMGIGQNDRQALNNLQIKTVIGLRARDATEVQEKSDSINYVRLPMSYSSIEMITYKIKNERFLRGDAVIYIQDLYKDIIDNETENMAKLFDYLCDESNYPIVYYCYFGKDQSGLATYFLLRALDVPMEDIEDDYLASNQGIRKILLEPDGKELSEIGQEALTLITSTEISYLRYALSCIRKKSGSVEEYMTKDLGLTQEKRNKLKKILLYPQNQKDFLSIKH